MIPADHLPLASTADATRGPLALLAGVRVIDTTTSVAGPYATLLLADYGADVVKIERAPAGDDARAWGPPFLDGESLWFLAMNRNKRSLALDIATPEGRATLEALVSKADVFVTNQVGASQSKLGIDPDRLAALNPALVHVSITGFGTEGARSHLPCYDLIAEGYSGVMDLTGELDSGPQKIGTPAADLLSGMDAAMAVIAALHERKSSGKGHRIDVSMVESMTRFMSARIVPYLGSGELARRSGARDSVIAVYQVFETADAPITLGLGNEGLWRRFWEAIGQAERGRDPAFDSNVKRRAARAQIVAEIEAILRTRPRAAWLRIFAEHRIPAGPINRVEEVGADPELQARGLVYAIERNGVRLPQVGLGVHVDGSAATQRRTPPRLGEHNAEVLKDWLG